jgi:hypothetical protein
MPRTLAAASLLALVSISASPAADSKLSVKTEDAAPPMELAEPVRALLAEKGMSVFDEKGKLVCTVWPVKSVDTKATAAQAKAGLKYSQVEETTIVGAVKFADAWPDYRKQKIKAGVYTLRMAVQPMDGDHMGTAPYNEFALLLPAAEDRKAELLDVETLHELSKKSTTRKHPGMMLLFPNKSPAEAPAIEAKPKDHFVLSYGVPAKAGGESARLGFSVVIVGQTMAE